MKKFLLILAILILSSTAMKSQDYLFMDTLEVVHKKNDSKNYKEVAIGVIIVEDDNIFIYAYDENLLKIGITKEIWFSELRRGYTAKHEICWRIKPYFTTMQVSIDGDFFILTYRRKIIKFHLTEQYYEELRNRYDK